MEQLHEACEVRMNPAQAPSVPLVLHAYTMKRQRKPERWQFIKLIPQDSYSNVPAAEFKSYMAKEAYCTKCNVRISFRVGQSNSVRTHMESVHRLELKDFVTNKRARQHSNRQLGNDESTSSDREGGANKPSSTVLVTDQQQRRANRLLVKWIAVKMRPICLVDDLEFRAYIHYLTHGLGGVTVKVPGRTELTTEIKAFADEMRGDLKQKIADGCRYFSCTTDIWTDRAQRSFIAVTLHYINLNFEMRNWTLEVKPLPGKHTGEAIANALSTVLDEWGLSRENCVALLRDGASNGVSAGNQLRVPHYSCVAHSLHLVVGSVLVRKAKSRSSRTANLASANPLNHTVCSSTQTSIAEAAEELTDEGIDDDDGDNVAAAVANIQESACTEMEQHLENRSSTRERTIVDEVRTCVQVFRSLAVYFHRSPKAKNRLAKIQTSNKLERLEVVLDCPTRWNSSRDMLSRFIRIQVAIDKFFQYISGIEGRREFSDVSLTRPSTRDWFIISCLVELLDPIWSTTEHLSGEGYPTLGLAFPCLESIESTLQDDKIFDGVVALFGDQNYVSSTLSLMHEVRRTMLHLFRDRFSRSAIMTTLKWVSILDPRLSEMSYFDPLNQQLAKDSLIDAAVEEASTNRSAISQAAVMSSPPLASRDQAIKRNARKRIFGTRASRIPSRDNVNRGNSSGSRSRVQAELMQYLAATNEVPDDVDPVLWWKKHAKHYPFLAPIARKWLGCVSTSVPSERAFSTSGNIISARRCSLAPSLVRDLVFIAENCKSSSTQLKSL